MPFGSLWLPVLVSAVVVFVLSALAHMALKHHRADYKRLPNEDAVAGVLKGAAPGLYMMPYCSHSPDLKDPKVVKRYEDGPIAIVTVLRNGPPPMGKYLGQWFALCILISFVTAYIARHTLHPGAAGIDVMRLTGTVAFVGYALGSIQASIWKAIPWSNALREIADAAVYSVATGLVFQLLWPAL